MRPNLSFTSLAGTLAALGASAIIGGCGGSDLTPPQAPATPDPAAAAAAAPAAPAAPAAGSGGGSGGGDPDGARGSGGGRSACGSGGGGGPCGARGSGCDRRDGGRFDRDGGGDPRDRREGGGGQEEGRQEGRAEGRQRPGELRRRHVLGRREEEVNSHRPGPMRIHPERSEGSPPRERASAIAVAEALSFRTHAKVKT